MAVPFSTAVEGLIQAKRTALQRERMKWGTSLLLSQTWPLWAAMEKSRRPRPAALRVLPDISQCESLSHSQLIDVEA